LIDIVHVKIDSASVGVGAVRIREREVDRSGDAPDGAPGVEVRRASSLAARS